MVDGLNKNCETLKRTLAVHDLSCFGKCALTVVLPTLSAMGIETVPIPTALLSTHTGGFEGFYFNDLTLAMEKISEHLNSINVEFDAIYTGFLGSKEQIAKVSNIIDIFSKRKESDKSVLILVDPVMGDDGKLYSTYTNEMVCGVRNLCAKADIITPNITEACFLTESEPLDTSKMSSKEINDYAFNLCKKLRHFCKGKIALTGLHYNSSNIGTYGFEEEGFICGCDYVEKSYPGTGDLFASVLLGDILNGENFKEAVFKASYFTRKVIDYSSKFDYETRNGVRFEKFLSEL